MSSEVSARYVMQLGTQDLCAWLWKYSGINRDKLLDACKVITMQKIDGANFLACTWQMWMSTGLALGVAQSLVAVAELISGKSNFTMNSAKRFDVDARILEIQG
jgi:hypothetical protein